VSVKPTGWSARPSGPAGCPGRRDLAVLELLRQTGVRVGELCALGLGDVAVGERKGTLTVRSGNGGTYRQVPLNADARRALAAYLTVRPASRHCGRWHTACGSLPRRDPRDSRD
jgi:site-specific recombinase XerD